MKKKLNNVESVVDLIIKCENSPLVSFSYRDDNVHLSFNKLQGMDELSVTTEIKKEQNKNSYKHNENTIMDNNIVTEKDSETLLNSLNENEHEIIESNFVGIIEYSDKFKFGGNGQLVSRDEVICSIEAMKIYNEVRSHVSGEVVELLSKGSSMVEFGQPIMKVKVKKNE